MKKLILIILLILALVITMVPALFAAEKPSISEEITGILPTSPFYFLKEFRRGVKRAFIANPASKAEYELHVASQKVAELKKLKELYPNDSGEIKTTILNYSENIKQSLEDLKADHPSIKNKIEEVQAALEALTK